MQGGAMRRLNVLTWHTLAIRHALLLPRESVIAELTVLPVHEAS